MIVLNKRWKHKLKLEKINNIIKGLGNLYNNIWVPAPEYIKESKNARLKKLLISIVILI